MGLLAPSLPGDAGHYVATVLTPRSYPFAIEAIQYTPIKNDDVPTCNGSLAHQVMLFAIDGDTLPETPSATGLGYRSYDVPADPSGVDGRHVEVAMPIPLILTEGQRAVVAIQFAVEGDEHLCVANCLSRGGEPGLDYWSNGADAPFAWQDLVADFGLNSQMMTRVFGTLMR